MAATNAPVPELLGLLGLARGELLLLDSAPLVYLVEGSGRRRAFMEALHGAAGRGELRLAVSVLAWTELLRKPLAEGNAAGATELRRLLADASRLLVLPVEVAVAEAAAVLLAERPRLALPDALHLATARVAGAGAVLTNDEAWKTAAPRGLRVLLLDELASALAC